MEAVKIPAKKLTINKINNFDLCIINNPSKQTLNFLKIVEKTKVYRLRRPKNIQYTSTKL